ncbi:hypothetical protein KIN20_011208 [Parelaphostrongylus tenuis]|uniref:Metallo-beta-lactamase domain-containing protein n=1 Tax=Parelaphostrongylus tenuis TaxID=148309 RepID=A0AAD5MZY6_PARTN|nr:hypothetical protein KIN20_011208 [Parelaphostrongylus tenuis]
MCAVLTTPATTEQLRQWILENQNSIFGETSLTGSTDLATLILRLFGLDKSTSTIPVSTTPVATTTTRTIITPLLPSARDVCPFSGEPLMFKKEFMQCRPAVMADCPVGFLCEQSFVLGKSICCRDKSVKPIPKRPSVVQPNSIRSPFLWSKITPTASQTWNVYPTAKKVPWYIKDRTTSSSAYNRVTSGINALTTEETSVTTTEPATTTTDDQSTPIACLNSTVPPVNPRGQILKTTTATQRAVTVSVLQTGSYRPLQDGQSEVVGAITLINDNDFYVLVDTGASSDTERLLHSLSKEGVTIDQINSVVITHGHPGHMGNMNFFGHKPIIFDSMEYIGRHITPTSLTERPYRKLSPHIEVWKTPGHTQHDLSILVHDVPNYGTMAVVGDLIPSETFFNEKRDILDKENIWDSAIKRQNGNLIICMADWIIPGHGQPFRVLPGYRQRAGCAQLLAQ